MPGWVMGGSFNQIEEDIIGLNRKREALEQDQLSNEFNSLRTRDMQAQQDFQQKLSDRFGEEKPMTLGDAYRMGQGVALSSGRPKEAIDFAEAMDRRDREERNARIQALTQGRMLGGAGAYDAGSEILQAAGIDPATVYTDEFRRMQQMRGMFSGATDRIVMTPEGPQVVYDAPDKPSKADKEWVTDMETGASRQVPVEEAERLHAAGTHAIGKPSFEAQRDLIEQQKEERERQEREAAEAAKPGLLDQAIGWIAPGKVAPPKAKANEYAKAGTEREIDSSFEIREGVILRSKRDGKEYVMRGGKMVPYERR